VRVRGELCDDVDEDVPAPVSQAGFDSLSLTHIVAPVPWASRHEFSTVRRPGTRWYQAKATVGYQSV